MKPRKKTTRKKRKKRDYSNRFNLGLPSELQTQLAGVIAKMKERDDYFYLRISKQGVIRMAIAKGLSAIETELGESK